MIEELEKCPFCGLRPYAVTDDAAHWWVECYCGASTASRNTEDAAIGRWNHRAGATDSKRQMLASERIAAALEAIAVRLDSITSATEGEAHYLRTSQMR